MRQSEHEVGPADGVSDSSSVGERLAGWAVLPPLVVAVLTMVGAAIRVAVAHQSLAADELATYWIISTHGPGGVISTIGHVYPGGATAEITPPLYFIAAWLTTQLGHTPELVRGPSLVAGAASIPVIYLLGLRTVGRRAALAAAAFTAFSPFMIYYSAEARAYALMMALVMLSTLTMLIAIDTRRARWWFVYAAASCAAVYTHYTCVFLLSTQLVWLLWAHPEARKPALLANLGAFIAFLPWIPSLLNQFDSPTTNVLSALLPFTWNWAWISFEHTTIGYPDSLVSLAQLPGTPALVLLALAIVVAVTGIAITGLREHPRVWPARLDRRMVLVFVLVLSVPLGEAIVSAFGTHIFGGRNLAAAWPGSALLFGALVTAARPGLSFVAAALAIVAFALGAAKMLDKRYQKPDYQAGANFIDRRAAAGDVVIDETGFLSPGPLTAFDAASDRRLRVFRAAAPAIRDRPFMSADRDIPLSEAVPKAVAAADGGRIFLIGNVFFPVDERMALVLERSKPPTSPFPARYRVVEQHAYPGTLGLLVQVWADRALRQGG